MTVIRYELHVQVSMRRVCSQEGPVELKSWAPARDAPA